MTTMRRSAVLAVALVGLLAACRPLGLGEASAIGTASAVEPDGDTVALSFVPDPGYEYYSGTIFHVGPGVDVWDSAWEAMDAADIPMGSSVEVWVDACAESFPVQCDVTGVRVVG